MDNTNNQMDKIKVMTQTFCQIFERIHCVGTWKRKWTNYSGGEVEINKYQIMLTNQFEIRVKPWGKSGIFELEGSLQMKI